MWWRARDSLSHVTQSKISLLFKVLMVYEKLKTKTLYFIYTILILSGKIFWVPTSQIEKVMGTVSNAQILKQKTCKVGYFHIVGLIA